MRVARRDTAICLSTFFCSLVIERLFYFALVENTLPGHNLIFVKQCCPLMQSDASHELALANCSSDRASL